MRKAKPKGNSHNRLCRHCRRPPLRWIRKKHPPENSQTHTIAQF
jgi:hypothetical protein